MKVRVEANERALDDLQKVQSKAGDIADKAAEATPEGMSAAAGKVDQLLEEGVSIANRKGEEGDFLFGGDQVKEEPLVATKDARGKSPRSTIKAPPMPPWRISAVVSR